MSYSTFTSILTILPGLPQTSTASGYTDTTSVVSKHITRADSLINAKIAKRYSVPVTGSGILTTISEDITSYFTYRSFYSQDNLNRSEYFEELKNDAMQCLEDIRNAKIDLVDEDGNIIDESTTENYQSVDSTTRGEQTFFDSDDAFDWKFDDDRQESINGRR